MADEIGRAKITVEADTEGVKASISDVKDEVQSAGDAGDIAGEKIGGGFAAAGDKIDKSTEGIRKFQGAISGAIGAVTGLVAVGTALVGVMVAIATRAKKAQEAALNLATAYDDVEQSINAYDLAFEQTQDVDEAQYFATLRQIEASKDLTEEYKNQLLEKAHGVMESNKEIRKAEEAKRVWTDFWETRKALEGELIDDLVEKENYIFSVRMDNLEKLYGGKAGGMMLRQLEEIEEKLHRKRLDGIEAEKQKRIQAENEAAERAKQLAEKQAAAIANAIEREMMAVSRSLFGTGGESITTNMKTIVKELKEVTSALGRR